MKLEWPQDRGNSNDNEESLVELKPNKNTGVIDDPQYPCYKAEGLCRIRFNPPDENRVFACVNDPVWCRYLVKKKG
jgi:hypothetical protein